MKKKRIITDAAPNDPNAPALAQLEKELLGFFRGLPPRHRRRAFIILTELTMMAARETELIDAAKAARDELTDLICGRGDYAPRHDGDARRVGKRAGVIADKLQAAIKRFDEGGRE